MTETSVRPFECGRPPDVGRATDEDLPALRELFGTRPMRGAVRLAFVPGPSSSVGSNDERHHTLVLRAGPDGRVIGTGSRTVHEVWLGERTIRVGFLTRLRLVPGACTPDRLRAGYAWIDATRRPDEAPFDLTTIVADNDPARRLLERGLRGLPAYVPLASVETLVCSTARRGGTGDRRGLRPATERDRVAIAAFLSSTLRRRPLAPAWRGDDFQSGETGPSLDETLVVVDAGEIVAAGAVRDRRRDEEVVVAGYAPWLAAARPIVNVGCAVVGRPALPPPGSVLALGHVAALAVRGDDARLAGVLVDGLRDLARARGLALLAVSFASGHALREPLRRRLAARSYKSTLYAVSWRGDAPDTNAWDTTPPEIEASWL